MDKHYRDLLIRALKGTLDTASRREFDLWVADADNRRIYENALRIWGRRTAPHLGLQSRPRPALGAVAVPHRSLRNAAAGGTARAETPLDADTAHGGSRRRGRRRHALRGPSRPLPHTGSGQTGVLRLRRQVAGASDRRFDRMAPKRLDARLRQLLRRRKPQRKNSAERDFSTSPKIPNALSRSKWKGCAYGFTARNST